MNRNNYQCSFCLITLCLSRLFFHSVEQSIFTDRNIKYAVIVSNNEFAENVEIEHVKSITDNENAIMRKCEHISRPDKSIPRNSQEEQVSLVAAKQNILRNSNVWSSGKWNKTLLTR